MVNIRKPSMSGHIHTRHFVFLGDPEKFQLMKNVEERTHGGGDPPEYHQNLDHLVEADQHQRRHEAADDRRPRLHDGAAAGDGGESAQEAVADVRHVPMPGQNPFSEQRPAGDAGGGYSESPLVKEVAVIKAGGSVGDILQAEEVVADEAVGVAAGAEGEGEAEEVVEEATGGGVEDVGEHDVHSVLGADGAGAEHGEAELHGED
nr:hypothetical protein CR513_44452 [Ipomoea batatas]